METNNNIDTESTPSKIELRKAKDTVANRHGYADWFQIDMTDKEPFEKEEIKASMLDEVAEEYASLMNAVGQKTLTNTTASQAKDNVKDIVFYGDGDTFKLLCKASSVKEQWMKSTKAMEIEGVGCVVQVTTQQGDNVSEALTFVPNVRIAETRDNDSPKEGESKVISRKLVKI